MKDIFVAIALPWRKALTDSELLARLDRGDTASFEALFERHYDRVYGLLFRLVGNRVEAEDLLQEVFLKLYQRPPTAADTNVSAWLYRVATNAGYNAVRGRRRRDERNRHLVLDNDRVELPEQTAVQNEENGRVRQALTQLRPEQAQLLLLRNLGLSYAELATACQLNPNSVGKQLSRAGDAFRKAYQALEATD